MIDGRMPLWAFMMLDSSATWLYDNMTFDDDDDDDLLQSYFEEDDEEDSKKDAEVEEDDPTWYSNMVY